MKTYTTLEVAEMLGYQRNAAGRNYVLSKARLRGLKGKPAHDGYAATTLWTRAQVAVMRLPVEKNKRGPS